MAGTPDTPTNPPALSLLNRTLGEWKNVRGYLKQDLGTIQKWMNNVPHQPTHIDPRVVTVQSSAMPGIDTDTTDVYVLAQQATAILSFSASLQGNPVEGQLLTIRIFDNGTPQSITWGASFSSNGATLPTTTIPGSYLYVQCRYNGVLHVWECLEVGNGSGSAPGQALTKTNDTNVTATLTGTPASALLKAVNIALGWTGLLGLARGGTNADLSSTGGASQFLRQNSVGAAVTVVRPASSDLSDASNIPLLSAKNTFSNTGGQVVQGPLDLSSASAGQVIFPATQNASSNANTLDDYEEGTWTPSDGSGAGLSFTSVIGTYIKIGQLVMVAAQLVYPSTASGANAQIAGLPFTVGAPGGNIYGAYIFYTPFTSYVSLTIVSGGTTINIINQAGAFYLNSGVSTQQFRFVGFYRAAN